MSEGRVWWYRRRQWSGRVPTIGTDEWGRRTLVLPLGVGALVVAFWTCKCVYCDATREQTAYWRAMDDGPPDHPRPKLGGGDEATDDETKERV